MKLFMSIIFLFVSTSTFAGLFGSTEIVLTKANQIVLSGEVDEVSAAKVQQEAINLCAKEKSDIYLILSTPGGSVPAGNQLIDTLNALPCKFHTVVLFAASMGYQITQNLGTRYIIPSGVLMSHRMYLGGLEGQTPGELDSRLNFYQQVGYELDVIAAKRVGISVEEYQKLIVNELWLTGRQAVDANHADEIAKVRCGDDLQGTNVQLMNTMFGAVNVTFSNCPLVQGPLAAELVPNQGAEKDSKALHMLKTEFFEKLHKVK